MPGKGVVGRLLVLSVVAFVVLVGASALTFLDTGEQWASAEAKAKADPFAGATSKYDLTVSTVCGKYSDPDVRTMCENREGVFAASSQPTGRNPAWKPLAAAAGVAAFVSLMLGAVQAWPIAARVKGRY
jgi:hypothetical protein